MKIQFRILDEDLSGASVDLEESKIYRVGDSFQYDIFLQSSEPTASEGTHYFEFSIEKNVITFSKFSENVTYIDFINHSKNFVSQEYTYEVPCLFEFIGIKFALCDAADSWEKWAKIIEVKPAAVAPEPLKNPEMSAEEKNTLDNMFKKPERKNSFASPPPPANFGDFDVLKNKTLSFLTQLTPKNKKLLAMAGVVTFLIIALIIGYSSLQKYTAIRTSQKQQIASIQDIQNIKQIEVNLPSRFSNIRFISNQSDNVIVEGVVKDKEDILFLQKSFEKYKNIVRFKLLTAAEAIAKLNLILKSQNATLVTPAFSEVNYRLSLSGLIKSMDMINEIELAVSNQIPEVSDLDTSRVYSITDVDKDIDELLSAGNLNTRLTLKKNLADRTVYIGGYLSQGELSDLKAAVANLLSKYQNLIKVDLDVKDALSSLPFKIISVNTNVGFSSFMTDTGQKVFEGGEVDGIKVDKISPTEIIFSGKFPLVLKLDDALGAGTPSSAPAVKK